MVWNVWSILKENKLNNVLQVFEDIDIQIACICETWFDSSNGKFTTSIREAGYDNMRGGGTLVIYKKTLKVKRGEASTSKFQSFEFSYIYLNQSTETKMLLLCIYRKQEFSCTTFCEEVESFLDGLFEKAEVLIVVGDFNVWVDVEGDKDAKKLLTLMNAYGLTQLIREPTHIAGHTLDHLYVNKHQIDLQHEVINDTFNIRTDHYPYIVKLPSITYQETTETITFRKIKNIDMLNFKSEFQNIIDNFDFSEGDFSSSYKEFKTSSEKLLNKHAPITTRKVNKQPKLKWIDEEYTISKAKRRKLERVWRKSKTTENRTNYANQRNLCAELSITKQESYYSKLVEASSNNQKSLFKVVDKLLNKKNEKILPAHTDPLKLANEFNDYYIEKIDKLRETIPLITANTFETEKFEGEKMDSFALTTQEELKQIIKEFGLKTSIRRSTSGSNTKVCN